MLRELASRGELRRAIMIVPAGLVENWRRELNEVFNLDFEVFGAEGDVTDRKTNAFVKHNRLIASVDTLKRPARVKRLLDAPPWDVVIFDEAHHLSVYRYGNRVKKTENFKLAEALRDHCRDMLLLSAPPHQGDHFRFWMLIRLLHPEFFENEQDMVDKGVEVLKGGDHGAKTAAQKRFKRTDGPKVLVCTAAGREGINLQFARVLFNYDLPWNPMDLEQRIGRIHRYGQQSTAQVYNLVAADTIEGQIFLLLEEKLNDIARTLGKLDEQGQVAEDLRTQVLGQLSSNLGYDRLYQEALSDPTLKRTRQELEIAMTNASLARQVVFELFQDLDSFNIGDYRKYDDAGRGMGRLIAFTGRAARLEGREFKREDETGWILRHGDADSVRFTSDRDRALQDENVKLLGLEHPVVRKLMTGCGELPVSFRAIFGSLEGGPNGGLLTIWKIHTRAKDGRSSHYVIKIGMTTDGARAPWLEKLDDKLLGLAPADKENVATFRSKAVNSKALAQELVHRELLYSGKTDETMSYSATLLGMVGVNLQ